VGQSLYAVVEATGGDPLLFRKGSLIGMEPFSKRHRKTLNERLSTDVAKPPSDSTFRLLLAQLDVEGFESLLLQRVASPARKRPSKPWSVMAVMQHPDTCRRCGTLLQGVNPAPAPPCRRTWKRPFQATAMALESESNPVKCLAGNAENRRRRQKPWTGPHSDHVAAALAISQKA